MRERLCVLLAGDFPERPPIAIGGIQAVTWQLAAGLARIEDLDVHTLACERFFGAPPARRWRSRWRAEGGGAGTAHYLQTPRRVPHVVSSWTSDALYVHHALRLTGAQLIHAHGQVGYTIGAIRSGLPHVITPHGMLAREKQASADAPALGRARLRERAWVRTEEWCLAHARHMIVISPYVRRLVAPRTRAQLHDIPNPIDAGFFTLGETRRRQGLGGTRHAQGLGETRNAQTGPTLLTVGWLNARKRHELILRALPLLRERLPGASLRIVGNVEAGDARPLGDLRRLVMQLGVGEAVAFLQDLSHEQLLHEYRGASVYVHAASEESSPVAVAQAMAAGLPLCAVDIPGLHHLLVDGQTGVYARAATPAALAEAVLTAIGGDGESDALASALGEQAHRHARARFHPDAVARATADVYRIVLAQSRGAAPGGAAPGAAAAQRRRSPAGLARLRAGLA
jgi:glycosyltransferase involved in cell wall biosynthesis